MRSLAIRGRRMVLKDNSRPRATHLALLVVLRERSPIVRFVFRTVTFNSCFATI